MVHLQIGNEEGLAEEIRKYPVIYDKADNGYKDTVMVEKFLFSFFLFLYSYAAYHPQQHNKINFFFNKL